MLCCNIDTGLSSSQHGLDSALFWAKGALDDFTRLVCGTFPQRGLKRWGTVGSNPPLSFSCCQTILSIVIGALKCRHIFRIFNFWGIREAGGPARLGADSNYGLPHASSLPSLQTREGAFPPTQSAWGEFVERKGFLRLLRVRNHGRGNPSRPRRSTKCDIRWEVS